ncbi:stalk domain-containing protein [Paenibacillus sp. LjRoot56]|uniref:stalk domain-containing protein n=1 Tax=Paenibacillus sp. LjRoot56 TaxID=3342333 RepID=UPI003ED0ED37
MRKELKGMGIGFVLISLLVGGSALAAGYKSTIEVLFNNVNLTVNGKKVASDNILYNGTTYIPLRDVADLLGKKVGWDQASNTASINDPGFVPADNGDASVTWKDGEEDANLTVHFKDRSATVVIGRDHPNGTKMNVIFNEDKFGWPLELDKGSSTDIFKPYGDLNDGFSIHAMLHDFDGDGNPEIVLTAGDGLVTGHVWVFSYTSVSDVSKINPLKLELSEMIQQKVELDKNKLIIPYGSVGLFNEYDYTNGHFAKSVQ